MKETIIHKLISMAINADFKKEMSSLLRQFDMEYNELADEIGYVAVLLNKYGDYVTSSANLKKEDIKILQEFGNLPDATKITNDFHKIVFNKMMYFFKRHKSLNSKQIILVGVMTRKKEVFRIMATVLQSKQLVKELELAI